MDFFEFIKDSFAEFVQKLIGVLPKSPIYYLSSNPEVEKVMGYVNFFIPIYTIVGMLEGWLLAIVIYYGVSVILRWLKIIE